MTSRDQQLIDEILGGHRDAFAELIRPYQDRLFNLLYRLVGSADDAAELLQEALLRAYRGLGTYQGGSTFYTWLHRVALNVLYTDRRRHRLPTVTSDGEAGGEPMELSDPNPRPPSAPLEQAEKQQIVHEALAKVGETFRVVLVLKEIEGLRYEEIAELLSVPVGTVRSRLHRARSELRAHLKPYWDQGTL